MDYLMTHSLKVFASLYTMCTSILLIYISYFAGKDERKNKTLINVGFVLGFSIIS